MSIEAITLLMFGSLLSLLALGLPVAFACGSVGIIFTALLQGPSAVNLVSTRIFGLMTNYLLASIPLFILMGAAIGKTRAAADLYEAAHRWLYKLPGSLGVANVFGCSVFAAMCGSSPATCAASGAGAPCEPSHSAAPEAASSSGAT